MNRSFCFGLLAVAAGLVGCASTPPVHYYTLVAPAAQAAVASAPAPFLIDVLSVGIPERMDQSQMVVREGNGGVVVLDGERWAGPLSDEVRSALSSELTHRLGTQDVAGLPAPAGKRVLRVKLQVRRLDAWPGQRVQLAADWSLGFANDADSARLVCCGQFEEPASGGYPQLVQAQQRIIAALASQIAIDARGHLGANLPAGCTAGSAAASVLPASK